MAGLVRLLTLFAVAMTAFGADEWVKLTTPHFQLYTTAGEKKGREAILYFEQVRSFFLTVNPSTKSEEFPVRIVAFRSEKQYAPYRFNSFATAYYTKDENRDYIVMQDIAEDHYPTAIHEYTHLVIGHSGLDLPAWMNEGWADLYSTLKPNGKKAMVGDLIPGRVRTLSEKKMIPITELAEIDHKSPMYNERDKAGLFYAESWALMHMLYLAPGYRDNFGKFVRAVSGGKKVGEACTETLGKSVTDVQTDLENYFRSKSFYGALFDVKLSKSEEDPEVAQVGLFESGLILADLLAVTRKLAQAEQAYLQLAKMQPNSPEVEESLGYLSMDRKDNAGARKHFETALKDGSRSSLMCFRLGLMAHEAGDGPAAIQALERSVELKPDYFEARMFLADAWMREREHQKSLDILSPVKKVSPAAATWFFTTKAYDYAQIGNEREARDNADLALRYAKNDDQRQQAENVLKFLEAKKQIEADGRVAGAGKEARETSTVAGSQGREDSKAHYESIPNLRIEGHAKKLVCAGKSASLTIESEGKLKTFFIPDPGQVTIRHSGRETFDFACGPQKGYAIKIDYRPPRNESEADGVIRTMEF